MNSRTTFSEYQLDSCVISNSAGGWGSNLDKITKFWMVSFEADMPTPSAPFPMESLYHAPSKCRQSCFFTASFLLLSIYDTFYIYGSLPSIYLLSNYCQDVFLQISLLLFISESLSLPFLLYMQTNSAQFIWILIQRKWTEWLRHIIFHRNLHIPKIRCWNHTSVKPCIFLSVICDGIVQYSLRCTMTFEQSDINLSGKKHCCY